MGWEPDSDPGAAPFDDDEGHPISIIGVSQMSIAQMTDEVAELMFSAFEREMPQAASVVEEARVRWAERADPDEFESWFVSATAPYWAGRESAQADEPALEDECECGAAIVVPGPWSGRGVFTCDTCSRRWGVEVSDESQGIWPL